VSDGWVKRSHRYGLRLRAEEWYERKVPSNPGMIERITAESFHERHTRAAQTPVLMRVAGDVGGRVGLTGDRIRSESSVRSVASARSAQSSRSAQQVDRVVMTARARERLTAEGYDSIYEQGGGLFGFYDEKHCELVIDDVSGRVRDSAECSAWSTHRS
jgi:hypothetical protein